MKTPENISQQENEPKGSRKISHEETERFDREGFYGLIYFPDNADTGFGALEVHVDGDHPEKLVGVETRMYRVEEGEGTFTLDGISHPMTPGDVFIVKRGSKYSYTGKMKLFEINVPLMEEGE